eukprot:UN34248
MVHVSKKGEVELVRPYEITEKYLYFRVKHCSLGTVVSDSRAYGSRLSYICSSEYEKPVVYVYVIGDMNKIPSDLENEYTNGLDSDIGGGKMYVPELPTGSNISMELYNKKQCLSIEKVENYRHPFGRFEIGEYDV